MSWQLEKCSHNSRFKNIHEGLDTCFSLGKLQTLVNSYNKSFSDDKINFNKEQYVDAAYLHKQLEIKLKSVCNDEVCWLRQPFAFTVHDPELHFGTFKPPRPAEKFAWLSNKDISDVMYQIRDKNDPKRFRFIGPVPINFDNLNESDSRFWYSLTKQVKYLNLPKLLKAGVDKVGIVFNLDPHYKSGSHWVCIFCEFSKSRCEVNYFDSFAKSPPKEIDDLMNRLVKTAQKHLGVQMKKQINSRQTQFGNTECGVYCMRFLEGMVQNRSFDEMTKSIVSDKNINNWRDYFFRS